MWLPDRTPTLLSSAVERTVAPASVQEYTGMQQVTVVPTISDDRDLSGYHQFEPQQLTFAE